MNNLDQYTAITKYPCHDKQVKFKMFPTVPIQRFDRVCPICKQKWEITCSCIKRDKDNITLTRAEWQRQSA